MGNNLDKILLAIPDELRQPLTNYYLEIKRNFAQSHYEPSELNGGKFSEIVFRILEWHTEGGIYTALGIPIKDFGQSTKRFENKSSFNDSIRFHIPHVLNALYPIRNKRGVAHAAGEINPNYMDSSLVVSCTDWVMAELIRIFHSISVDEAQKIVEGLVTKQIPTIWEVGEHKRVISSSGKKLTTRDKVLLLLYSTHPKPITVSNLLTWTEYDLKNKPRFRNSILKDLHKEDLIHIDDNQALVHLSPLGVRFVENNLPLNF